ncbi:MAG: hypothetical protein AAGF99_12185 [Bacteroidota bacterium]
MPDRERFSEEQARAILKRAAERQHRADLSAEARTSGLSQRELERVAAAAGIEPQHVAAAIRDEERAEPEVPTSSADRFIGRPTRIHVGRAVSGRLDGALWQKIVVELRRTFETAGTTSTLGALHEWRSDASVQKNLGEFEAEEVDGEVHLRLRRSWASYAGSAAAWLVLGVGFGAFFMMVGFLEAAVGTSLAAILISLVVGVLGFALTRGWYRRFLDKEAIRSEQLMDRLGGLVTSHVQARELEAARTALQAQGDAVSEPRLDLDAVVDDPAAPAETAAQRARQRT